MRRFILLIGLLLVAWPAWGASQWAPCGSVSVETAAAANPDSANGKIVKGERECFYFNDTEDSRVFHVTASTGLICLNPDVASEGTATAEVMIRSCHLGATTADVNVCIEILAAPLDGTMGASGTQNSCVRVSLGDYYVENTTGAGDDEAIVSVQGE